MWSSGSGAKVCRLQDSPTYGNIIDILTASLILLAAIFDALVYYYVEYLPLYGEDDYYNDLSSEMHLMNRPQMMTPITPAQQQQPEPQSTDPLLTDQQQPHEVFQPSTENPTSPVPSSLLSGSLNSNPSSQRSSIQPRHNSGPQVTYTQLLRTAPAMKAQRDERLSRTLPEQTADEVDELNFAPQISQAATSPIYNQSNVPVSEHRNSFEFREESPQAVTSPTRSFKDRIMHDPLQRPPNLNIDAAKEETPVTRMRYDMKSQRPLSPETDF